MPRVCVLLADGFEEIEAVTIIDVLRRAGVQVVTIGVTGTVVTGSHEFAVRADALLSDVGSESWDAVILPGGLPGARTLREHRGVQRMLREQHRANGRIAAICAAPIALDAAGVLEGRRATSYPGFALQAPEYLEDRVVVDGPITTSRGPGTAMEFALALVADLVGSEAVDHLQASMLVAPPA